MVVVSVMVVGFVYSMLNINIFFIISVLIITNSCGCYNSEAIILLLRFHCCRRCRGCSIPKFLFFLFGCEISDMIGVEKLKLGGKNVKIVAMVTRFGVIASQTQPFLR